MNPAIWRAYDVRGLVGQDFQPEDAQVIGQAFATHLLNRGHRKIIVGHDNRFTSDEISAYLIEGLMAAGGHVLDLGLTLVPFVNYAIIKHEAAGGVMVTASHNPKEYNGFRFILNDAAPLYNEELQSLRRLTESGRFITGKGRVFYDDGKVFHWYVNELKESLPMKKYLRIIIDCGNGTSSAFAQHLFESLGCRIVPLYCSLHGDYPHHLPDPAEKETLKELQALVVKQEADLGVAFDTDGDRFGVVDEKGKIYENDKTLIVFARDILAKHPGSRVLFDVKSSYVLAEEIKKAGGMPEMARTGHPYFRTAMMENKDIFLAGELSGHTFIKDNYYGYDDGLYAAARLIFLLSQTDRPYSDFFRDVEKTYHTEELKAPCPDEQKFAIVEKIGAQFKKMWPVIDIDGVRVEFSAKAWALVRASNTMPALSLRFEAESESQLQKIINLVREHLGDYPEVDLGALK